MKSRAPNTIREHVAQIQCDAADLYALLIMCATGCEGEEASRVMNAASVLTKIIHNRAVVVWDQMHDAAGAMKAV